MYKPVSDTQTHKHTKKVDTSSTRNENLLFLTCPGWPIPPPGIIWLKSPEGCGGPPILFMFMLPGNWELLGPIPILVASGPILMLPPVPPIGIPMFAPGAWSPISEGTNVAVTGRKCTISLFRKSIIEKNVLEVGWYFCVFSNF